jgi:hypothetical protein
MRILRGQNYNKLLILNDLLNHPPGVLEMTLLASPETLYFRDAKMIPRCQITLAPEPVFHADLQAVEWNAVAHLKQAIPNGQRVIEDGVIREVPHGEAIYPFDGTRIDRSCGIDAFDSEFADEHDQAKSRNSGESIDTVCIGPVSLPVAASRRNTVTEAES